jgi:hypothetical protein
VIDPNEGGILLPIANELWNTVFTNSREKAGGSFAGSGVQEIVAEPPEERFDGTLSVRAETRGMTKVKTLELVTQEVSIGRVCMVG